MSFFNAIHDPPAAADRNDSLLLDMAGINGTSGEREFNGPSRESGTESIMFRHSPMRTVHSGAGPTKPERETLRTARTPSADLMFCQSQFNLSTEYAVYDGIVDDIFSSN